MHSADYSTEARRASVVTPDPVSPPRRRRPARLHQLASIVGYADAARIAAYVLMSLIAALLGSVAAIVLVPLIQAGHAPDFGGRTLALPAGTGALTLIFAVSMGSHVLLRWWIAGLGARIVGDCAMKLRGRVHARLLDADIAALSGSSSAEITNVLTANIEFVSQGIGAVLQLLVVGTTSAINLAFAFWVSPILTLTLPMLAGLGLLALRWHGREQSRVSQRYIEDRTHLFSYSEDLPRRLRHVRSFEREDVEKAGYGAVSARLALGYRRQIELVASGKLVMELLVAAGMIGIFLLAGRWGGVDQASLLAVGLLLGRLLPYMASSRQNLQQLRLAVPAFELWQRYANLDAAPRHAKTATPANAAVRSLRIERVQVRFPSLHLDVGDVLLVPGEMTLIIGDSGIGKSSLADVLAGMTMPASFSANAGGRSMDFDAYRQLVRRGAYVSQSVRPWQRTVRECLLWAAPDSSEQRLHDVLADVGLDRRLHGTHGGLDTELQGPSCRLSGGELQRLLLAQVILRQPFIAVLDEATGALDAASEMKVLAALKQRLPETILVVVSHRQGTLDIADQCLRIGSGGTATIAKVETAELGAHAGGRPGAMG